MSLIIVYSCGTTCIIQIMTISVTSKNLLVSGILRIILSVAHSYIIPSSMSVDGTCEYYETFFCDYIYIIQQKGEPSAWPTLIA